MNTHEIDVTLGNDEVVVTFNVDRMPKPATGPSYSCGGEPGEGAEWTLVSAVFGDEAKCRELTPNQFDRVDDAIQEMLAEMDPSDVYGRED